MNNYDFKSLNDKEFEALACDLLGHHLGERFERFKAGRDSGVDGRFFCNAKGEVVLQCKHWANTPVSQLINKLSKGERPKVAKLKPAVYLLAISNSLSRKDKRNIKIAMAPFLDEAHIYGAEDLNDLLAAAVDVERRHYKLWLHSASVLTHMVNHAIEGRSENRLAEIISDTARYAVTENHQLALAQLESLGVVIITGEPGIGKTTLANHLCLHYVGRGFKFVAISDDIKEAESILDNDSCQVFYFDDFLGRNYLEALNGHEGQKITQFIRRIARNSSKRFILTSRSTILNQGKMLIDVFSHSNLQRNEYEMKISSLSALDKAHILYNQIWHSQLGVSYVNELYKDRRYRQIVAHKNYNPRLISYVTDASRLQNILPSNYWEFVERSLINPADIWENPFIAQQDDFGRAIVLLVVLNREPISQEGLAEAYNEYISLPANQNMKGRQDFLSNLKTLTGSFLNRLVDGGEEKIDVFNPSIGDYVLKRYSKNIPLLKLGFICLTNENSLRTLKSLHQNKFIGRDDAEAIATAMLAYVVGNEFANAQVAFVAGLVHYLEDIAVVTNRNTNFLVSGSRWVLEYTEKIHSTRHAFSVINVGVVRNWISVAEGFEFIERLAHFVVAEDEITGCWSLLSNMPQKHQDYKRVRNIVIKELSSNIVSNISRFVDPLDAFIQCKPGQYKNAREKLEELLEERLRSLGLNPADFDTEYLLCELNVVKAMDEFFDSAGTSAIAKIPSSQSSSISEDKIDDLFHRG